jgi:hypothetical protein
MLLYEDDDSQWFLEEDDDVTLQNDMESMTIDDIEYGYLLSIDIGVIHLGLSILAYDKNTYKFKDVMGVDCLDITTFPHPEHIPRCNCKLNHTKTFTDWMEHIFQYYSNLFDNVDHIIIERQPTTLRKGKSYDLRGKFPAGVIYTTQTKNYKIS